jgi:hypothetical protein
MENDGPNRYRWFTELKNGWMFHDFPWLCESLPDHIWLVTGTWLDFLYFQKQFGNGKIIPTDFHSMIFRRG